MKVEEPALGRKRLLPFKFLNFSRSVEVHTTEPRKLKKESNKSYKSKEPSLLHNSCCSTFIPHQHHLNGWQHLSSPYKVNTLYGGVCTTCKRGLWLLMKFSSPFRLPLCFSSLWDWGLQGFSLSYDY